MNKKSRRISLLEMACRANSNRNAIGLMPMTEFLKKIEEVYGPYPTK